MTQQLFYLFILLLLLFFTFSNSTRVPLTGNDWTIHNNQSYSATGQIPGTIHTILLAAKQIPEPYWGYNDVNLRSLIYTPWTFRKNFSLINHFLTFTQFTLHFDQIDTVANITMNGCPIGQTDNMFLAYTFNVIRSCLQSDNNQLQIDFQSPVSYALTQAQTYNDTVPPICPPDIQHGECYIQFIRKEPCSFSWNWVRVKNYILLVLFTTR
jgi:beta-mannosidase